MPRVMFVTTRAGGDGASRALGALISALPSPYDIRLVSLTSVEPCFLRWLQGRPDTPNALHMRGLLDLAALRRFAALVAGFRPHVLHTSLSRADWLGRVVGRLARVPRIVSTIQNVHSRMYRSEFGPVRARAGLALDRMTFPLTDRIVAVSEGVRADLERMGVGSNRIQVIPNGIDLGRSVEARSREAIRRQWGLDGAEVIIGTSALLKAQKGIEDLIEAARLLASRGCRATILIFGDGPLRRNLELQASDLHDGPCVVRFMGWIPDVMRDLPGLDLFVLASRWEGLPVALLEAMALGVPAVGTRVAGIVDVIHDDAVGRLVPPGRPDALADALEALVRDPGLRRRLGVAAARHAREHFDVRHVARAHDELYSRLFSSRDGFTTTWAGGTPAPL